MGRRPVRAEPVEIETSPSLDGRVITGPRRALDGQPLTFIISATALLAPKGAIDGSSPRIARSMSHPQDMRVFPNVFDSVSVGSVGAIAAVFPAGTRAFDAPGGAGRVGLIVEGWPPASAASGNISKSPAPWRGPDLLILDGTRRRPQRRTARLARFIARSATLAVMLGDIDLVMGILLARRGARLRPQDRRCRTGHVVRADPAVLEAYLGVIGLLNSRPHRQLMGVQGILHGVDLDS